MEHVGESERAHRGIELPTAARYCRVVLLLLIWLLLVIHAFRRQLYALKSSTRIARIKQLQYEVRKKLKREQQSSDEMREKLHGNAMMLLHGREPQMRQPCELKELRLLRCQIDAQLEQLECVLENEVN